MTERVVVFGGSGFLGSHVADELSARGYDVTIFDINPSPFLKPKQRMVIGDILDQDAVRDATQGADIVYSFAGLADINEAKDSPLRTAQLNIIGHLHILEAAREYAVKRFVYASTVYVYSESGSFYRVSKQTGEKLTELYQERFGVPFTILRYGSLYGRRADKRNAIYRFIESALEQSKIHYSGTGDEIREYIHVADAATASVDVLKDTFMNQHIVVTGHQQFRVRDVMMMIAEMLPQKGVNLEFANQGMDPHYNITPYSYKPRLGKKFVVNPFVDMGQGVLDCIHEFEGKFDEFSHFSPGPHGAIETIK